MQNTTIAFISPDPQLLGGFIRAFCSEESNIPAARAGIDGLFICFLSGEKARLTVTHLSDGADLTPPVILTIAPVEPSAEPVAKLRPPRSRYQPPASDGVGVAEGRGQRKGLQSSLGNNVDLSRAVFSAESEKLPAFAWWCSVPDVETARDSIRDIRSGLVRP